MLRHSGWHIETFTESDVKIFTCWYVETFKWPFETFTCWDVQTSTASDVKSVSFGCLTSNVKCLQRSPRYRYWLLLSNIWYILLSHPSPCSKQCWHHLEISTDNFYPCLQLPASLCLRMFSGRKWVLDLHMGRHKTRGLQTRSDPQPMQDEIWGISTTVSSPISGSTLSLRGSLLAEPQLSSVATSPTSLSWEHLPNNLLVPKSLLLILVGTQTKPSTKHLSCTQTEHQKAKSGHPSCQRHFLQVNIYSLKVCWSPWDGDLLLQEWGPPGWQTSIEAPHILSPSFPVGHMLTFEIWRAASPLPHPDVQVSQWQQELTVLFFGW